MAVDLAAAKQHLNITGSDDDTVISRLIDASTAHMARLLGFALDDEDEFPDGTPADLQHAQLMLVAHWFENREASLVGVTAMSVPFGVQDIVREHRKWSFGGGE